MFTPSLLRKKAVRWVLTFGLAPLAISIGVNKFELSFGQTVCMIQTYFCLFWALYFQSLLRPSWSVWRRGLGYALVTAIIGFPFAAGFEQGFLEDHGGAGGFLSSFYFLMLVVGPVEELCKALPLLVFGLRKDRI
jgi:RsiW-degrading membrane proteinase PrsW (M82 family)